MFDRFCSFVEYLSDKLVRSSDIMQYSVSFRRLVLFTFPISIPLIVIIAALGSAIVYTAALILSIITEVRDEGVDYLFHAPSLADLYR